MPAGAVSMRTSLADVVASLASLIRGESAPSDRVLPGASAPIPQVAPEGTLPRGAVIPFGYNTSLKGRTGTGKQLSSFDQLRALANYDMVAAVKYDIKNAIVGNKWEIRVREEFKGQEIKLGKRVDEIRRFVQRPDPLAGRLWPQVCGQMVEEILVTDALTILPRMNLGGELIALEMLDGATIIPLVDDRGRPPLPPQKAYSQVVYGAIETSMSRRIEGLRDYTSTDLLYLPRNPRVDVPYGWSPVEGLIFAINLAIRQDLYDLSYFTDGNVPDGGFWALSETVTPEQLESMQEKLDALSVGRDDVRAGYMRLMYDGTYVSTKGRQWLYENKEWLARQIAWNFGVSPAPVAKQMNRSTSEQLAESAKERGVRPIADFIAAALNLALREFGGVEEVEFAWSDEATEDPSVVYQRNVAYVNAGILTRNEVRQSSALDQFDFDTPPMVGAPAAPQLLEKLIEDLKNPPKPPGQGLSVPVPGGAPSSDVAPGSPADDSQPPSDDDPTAQEKAWHVAFTKYRAAVVTDLRKWRDVATKRAKEGRVQKLTFKSRVLPPYWRKDVAAGVSSCTKQFSDRASVEAVFKSALRVFKGELKPTKARSKVENAIIALVDGWLRELEPKAIAWAMEQLPDNAAEKLWKANGPDFSAGDLAGDLAAQLEAGGGVGASEASLAIGVNLERVPPEVQTYARRRAGELVGKQYLGGEWVDSTTGSAISDTLRAQVQDAVSLAIEESWTPAELSTTLKGYFEISRAQTIARTETAVAYGNGAAELYKTESIEQLNVKDGPGCLPFGHDDNAPAPADEKGIVQAEAQAEGQVWTVGQYQSAIIGHPNCCPGSELVTAPNVRAAFSRRYEGEVVVLRTAADDLLTCTPNHPVLTTRGWLAAGSLHEGDDVIRCGDAQGMAALVDPHHEHVPARIDEVASALLESSAVPARLVPAAAENFHGDGSGGDVHVIDADGLAGNERHTPLGEQVSKLDLDGGAVGLSAFDASRAPTAILDRPLHATDSIVSGGGSPAPLFWADADLMEAEALRLSAHREPMTAEEIPDASAVTVDALGDRVGRLASLIAPVQIVAVERHAFSGEVFNLETVQGWYVASGIITHNCVRVATPYFAG